GKHPWFPVLWYYSGHFPGGLLRQTCKRTFRIFCSYCHRAARNPYLQYGDHIIFMAQRYRRRISRFAQPVPLRRRTRKTSKIVHLPQPQAQIPKTPPSEEGHSPTKQSLLAQVQETPVHKPPTRQKII